VPTDPSSVAVVIPTYNERENLSSIVNSVTRFGYRVLVVDDNSPDGTGDLADGLAHESELVRVLHRTSKQGLGPAYADGFRQAIGAGAEILCEMDADFSHDPATLPRLVAAVERGADLAIGSRYVEGGGVPDWPFHRRMLSKGGNTYAKLMLQLPVNDATGGFRAFRKEALTRLHPETCLASGYAFQVEMTWRAVREGMRIEEVPITFRDRTAGKSKMGLPIVLEAMWLVTKWGVTRRDRR
jgi:dolichol-phosphate mannosyltransferase